MADIQAAARALLPVPRSARAAQAEQLMRNAQAADRYRARHGKAHPHWGNGTLMAAALAHPTGTPAHAGDPDYQRCLRHVLDALIALP